MKTRNRVAPSAPPRTDSPSMAWCRFVSAACLDFDWSQVAADTIRDPRLAAVVAKGLESVGRYIQREIDRVEANAVAYAATTTPDPLPENDDDDPAPPVVDEPSDAAEHHNETPPIVVDERTAAAASLLGVDVGATEDQVRAALRARLASSKLHPEHGGDGEAAKELIAAKNLLVEQARSRR